MKSETFLFEKLQNQLDWLKFWVPEVKNVEKVCNEFEYVLISKTAELIIVIKGFSSRSENCIKGTTKKISMIGNR